MILYSFNLHYFQKSGTIPINRTQLYKNRCCGLVVIPEVIDDIRSKRGTFDWLTAKY